MKILVTGADGFIGQAQCAHLSAEGHTVIPVVRRPSDNPNAIVLDNGDEDEWRSALSGCDSIIHLAAQAHGLNGSTAAVLNSYRASNVTIATTLAQRAVDAGISRFVFVSTVKVNGEITPDGEVFTANDPPNPQDAYAISKWEAEQALLALVGGSGMDLVIVRPPLVYGPRVKGNFAAIVNTVRRRIPLPFGAIHNQRSMIGVDNLVSFLGCCADQVRFPNLRNETFLLSDGEPLSTPQLIRKIAAAFDVSPILLPVPPGLMRIAAELLGQTGMVDRLLGSLVVDDTKAREMFGWQPPVSIDEQLRRMSDAARS